MTEKQIILDSIMPILNEFKPKKVILFGSYASNKYTSNSDLDLYIEGAPTGIRFYGFIEKLRIAVDNKISIDITEPSDNLSNEVLINIKNGETIYAG